MKKALRILSMFWGLSVVLLFIVLTPLPTSAQATKPLTYSDLVQMKAGGFDDPTIIKAIQADGVSLDTSVKGLIALKHAGFSEKVIDAVLTAKAPKKSTSGSSASNNGLPEDIGVYVKVKSSLNLLPVEVVDFRTRGVFASAFTYGLKKAKFDGTIPGKKSSEQLTDPVTFVLRCADGTAPTEYQLIRLHPKKDSREFTESKMGLMGVSGGVDNQAILLKFHRVGHDTYSATSTDLQHGEYGFLAPGAIATTNGASSGKLYTFGIGK